MTLTELLGGRPSRGELKRRGAALDQDAELRSALLGDALRRGLPLPADAAEWPGKRLLRAALDRRAAAQVRRNPIVRDEGFVCVVCGTDVAPAGHTARNHCPRCLVSLHVDDVPGDRAARCGGELEPVGVQRRGADEVLLHRCRRCGVSRRVRVLPDDERSALEKLAAR